jgi:hypothetical protein
MNGVGYRVPSAQGPETTRHGAELHPIANSTMRQTGAGRQGRFLRSF